MFNFGIVNVLLTATEKWLLCSFLMERLSNRPILTEAPGDEVKLGTDPLFGAETPPNLYQPFDSFEDLQACIVQKEVDPAFNSRYVLSVDWGSTSIKLGLTDVVTGEVLRSGERKDQYWMRWSDYIEINEDKGLKVVDASAVFAEISILAGELLTNFEVLPEEVEMAVCGLSNSLALTREDSAGEERTIAILDDPSLSFSGELSDHEQSVLGKFLGLDDLCKEDIKETSSLMKLLALKKEPQLVRQLGVKYWGIEDLQLADFKINTLLGALVGSDGLPEGEKYAFATVRGREAEEVQQMLRALMEEPEDALDKGREFGAALDELDGGLSRSNFMPGPSSLEDLLGAEEEPRPAYPLGGEPELVGSPDRRVIGCLEFVPTGVAQDLFVEVSDISERLADDFRERNPTMCALDTVGKVWRFNDRGEKVMKLSDGTRVEYFTQRIFGYTYENWLVPILENLYGERIKGKGLFDTVNGILVAGIGSEEENPYKFYPDLGDDGLLIKDGEIIDRHSFTEGFSEEEVAEAVLGVVRGLFFGMRRKIVEKGWNSDLVLSYGGCAQNIGWRLTNVECFPEDTELLFLSISSPLSGLGRITGMQRRLVVDGGRLEPYRDQEVEEATEREEEYMGWLAKRVELVEKQAVV